MGSIPIAELQNIDLSDPNTAIYLQLYNEITKQIINQEISNNVRLPASRQLASQLNISRNTVQKAYEQLIAEGYLIAKRGSGIYVCAEIPESYSKAFTRKTESPTIIKQSNKSKLLAPGIPDLESFPHQAWHKASNKVMRLKYKSLLCQQSYFGDQEFINTLHEYLTYSRNIKCDPKQIIITTGAQEAINITMHTVLSDHAEIAIENPGYRGAYQAIKTCGIRPKTIPVIEDGISIEHLNKLNAKLVYITPSHQYPLGMTIPISKRLQLLEYARKNNSYIIEDDYDSEYHFKTKPLPSLQGLDKHDRVIYLGTFSKVMFPAIRIGYIIAPKSLLEKFQNIKQFGYGPTPLINQFILTNFIQSGEFGRHVKRMRVIYAKKYKKILAACNKYLDKEVKLYANDIGMHITLQLPQRANEKLIIQNLNAKNLFPAPLSGYYKANKQKGLVIGFANLDTNKIASIIKIIAQTINKNL